MGRNDDITNGIPSPNGISSSQPSNNGVSSQLLLNTKPFLQESNLEPLRKRQRRDPATVNVNGINSSSKSIAKEIWTNHLETLNDPLEIEKVLTELRKLNLPSKLFSAFGILLKGQYLDYESLLNCRLVCTQLNNSIKEYIQEHPAYLELVPPGCFEVDFIYDKNKPDEKIEEILSLYQPNENPFMGRSVSFSIESYVSTYLPESEEWCRKITTLLEIHGMHIWYCSFHFGDECLEARTAYRILYEWIKHMPNLKSLKVMYEDHMQDGEVEGLMNEIVTKPLSDLNNVVILITGNLPYLIFNEIANHIPKNNLDKIKINAIDDGISKSNANGVNRYDWSRFENSLRRASITLDSKADFFHLESSALQWPLCRLYLDLDIPEKGNGQEDNFAVWINWNRIFLFLEQKFGSTLVHLSLELPRATSPALKKEILKHSLHYRLNMLKVKILHLKIYNVTSIDFLLPLKDTLENLFIEFCLVDWSSLDTETLAMVKSNEKIRFHSSRIFRQGSTPYNNNTGFGGVNVNINEEFVNPQFLMNEFPKLQKAKLKFSNCFVVKI